MVFFCSRCRVRIHGSGVGWHCEIGYWDYQLKQRFLGWLPVRIAVINHLDVFAFDICNVPVVPYFFSSPFSSLTSARDIVCKINDSNARWENSIGNAQFSLRGFFFPSFSFHNTHVLVIDGEDNEDCGGLVLVFLSNFLS